MVSTGEIFWSEETFRIFEYDPAIRPTVELVLQRIHPDDKVFARQVIDRAAQDVRDQRLGGHPHDTAQHPEHELAGRYGKFGKPFGPRRIPVRISARPSAAA